MDILNFISWIKGKRQFTTVNPAQTLVPVGLKDPKRDDSYLVGSMKLTDLKTELNVGAVQDTGLDIDFTTQKVFNTATAPGTGNITNDLTGAQLGIAQKIYHNSLIAPSMPAGWVLVGEGFYIPGSLNIIYAEFCGGTRVEYWVTQ